MNYHDSEAWEINKNELQLEASIAKLTEDIGDLTKAVAELDAAMVRWQAM